MNQIKQIMLFIIILKINKLINKKDMKYNLKNNNQNKSYNCKCYKIKCFWLEFPDISCKDKFENSCTDINKIVLKNNSGCDCCIENMCFDWKHYDCIIYRTFKFSKVFYFILINLYLLIIINIYYYLFDFNTSKNINKSIKIKKESKLKKITIKFTGKIFITFNTKLNLENNKLKILKLINDIKKLKTLAKKNLIQLIILCLNYFFIILFYIFLNIYSFKPFLYIKFSWFLHILSILFLIFVYIIYNKIFVYSNQIKIYLKNFEKNHECFIKINGNKKLIEFNFKHKENLNNEKQKRMKIKNKRFNLH